MQKDTTALAPQYVSVVSDGNFTPQYSMCVYDHNFPFLKNLGAYASLCAWACVLYVYVNACMRCSLEFYIIVAAPLNYT